MNSLIRPITKSHIARGKLNGLQQFRGMKANYIGTLETYWIILKHTISHTKYQKEDKEQYVRNVLIMAGQFIKHEIKSYILDWRISSKIFLLYKGKQFRQNKNTSEKSLILSYLQHPVTSLPRGQYRYRNIVIFKWKPDKYFHHYVMKDELCWQLVPCQHRTIIPNSHTNTAVTNSKTSHTQVNSEKKKEQTTRQRQPRK